MKYTIEFSTFGDMNSYSFEHVITYGRGDSALEAGTMNGVSSLTAVELFIEWEAGCHFAHIMGDGDEI